MERAIKMVKLLKGSKKAKPIIFRSGNDRNKIEKKPRGNRLCDETFGVQCIWIGISVLRCSSSMYKDIWLIQC